MEERYLKNDGEVLYLNSGNADAVRTAQRYLNKEGYTDAYGNKLAEDGEYGKNTFNAVIKYQRANGLTEDGKIGDETWNHMWSNSGGKGNSSEHNDYAEKEYNLGGMKVPEYRPKTTTNKRAKNILPYMINDTMMYVGTKLDIDNESNIYSPNGYVEEAERDNAKRNREEPITGMQNPYDMASYAQNYSDTIEWLYQKNRLSK